VGELQFLQSHHMQHLDHCPRVPAAVASQKTVIFRNVQDISHFHSRFVGLHTCTHDHEHAGTTCRLALQRVGRRNIGKESVPT
jgi:obscurin-RhoGEF protein